MHINQSTIDLVKRFEGLKLKAYQDSVGVWTIGYGTTSRAGIGVQVRPGMTITEGQAEDYLRRGLEKFAKQITSGIKAPATPNEFGAMLSLAYNIGPGAFLKSTCLRRFNSGDTAGAAEALTWFNKAGGKKLRGLVRRRQAEHDLMLTDIPVEATPPADKSLRENKAQSTTLQATGVTAASILTACGTVLSKLDPVAQIVVVACAAISLVALGWIARERIRKWAEGER